jgi:hypothetical protein
MFLPVPFLGACLIITLLLPGTRRMLERWFAA